MLNYLWLGLVLCGAVIGGFQRRMPQTVEGAIDGAQSAVTLAIGLVGVMALWLGAMRLAERAGLVHALSRGLRPLLRRLFPDVPEDHPAMGAMVMNLAANMLGLTNAATPLGLRAMRDLETLNRRPGTATNAMCTFLAINTSSVQLIPMSAVAILAAKGAANPSAIIGTAFLATLCSTAAGIAAVKTLERLRAYRLPTPAPTSPEPDRPAHEATATHPAPLDADSAPATAAQAPLSLLAKILLALFVGCFLWFLAQLTFPPSAHDSGSVAASSALVRAVNGLSLLAIPFLVAFFPLYAALRRIPVYEEFVEGAKEGFHVAVRIIPYLVAMLVAIGLFRGAGGIDLLTRWLRPAMDLVGFPPELLPMALVRPLTGSGSLAVLSDLVDVHGPDHLISRMAGTLFGSTETTFYVIAVYFGSVNVRGTRHAVPAGLIADAVGVIASVIICRWVFG